MEKEKGKSRWKNIRETFNTIHLWLGVGSGIILFLVCFSGTVYTFSTEIQKVTDSELYTVSVPESQKPLPTESLISSVLDSLHGGIVQSIIIPEANDASYQIVVAQLQPEKNVSEQRATQQPREGNNPLVDKKGPAEQKGAARPRGTTYFVNPYTGQILGTNETTSSKFFMFMFRLHRWLLLDMEIGRPIVGVATLIFVVIIITGLVIWVPKKIKNWKQGLTIKTSANWKRINNDLHNALGIYASLFLLVMALTGLTWSFEWYKKGFTGLFVPKKTEKQEFKSVYTPESKQASIENYLSSAGSVLPYEGDYRVTLPSDSAGVVVVSKTRNSFFATSVADRLSLDQYSTEVLNKELFADKTFGEQVVASIKAIHLGSFYGTFSKIVYFIACLIGTSLPVTGTMIWINKLRKKKKKKLGQAERKNEPVVVPTASKVT